MVRGHPAERGGGKLSRAGRGNSCDVCHKRASQRVSIEIDGRTLLKSLCKEHLVELLAGARLAPWRSREAHKADTPGSVLLMHRRSPRRG